jgi:hypothetical protein
MEWMPALVAISIVVLFPVLDRGKAADLRDRPTEAERLRLYRHSFIVLWSATAAALAVDSGWRPMQVPSPSSGPSLHA